tara:strand:- start:116 stop:868 length:753 start_codon:yes stop_codon:yes gene_type:complete
MSAIALSKMNKKQLYDKCKELTADNLSHQLFNNTLKEELQTATNIVVEGEMGSTILKMGEEIEKLKETILDLEEARDSASALDDCVEDSIANQFDELGITKFCNIEELYDAYHKSTEMVKAQDEHIAGCQNQVEEIEMLKVEFKNSQKILKKYIKSDKLSRGQIEMLTEDCARHLDMIKLLNATWEPKVKEYQLVVDTEADIIFNAESSEEEGEDTKVLCKCVKCCRDFYDTKTEYKCSEGECLDCQKYG